MFSTVVSGAAAVDLGIQDKMPEGGDYNRLQFDWYKDNLTGRPQEAAMAQLLLEDESDKNYSPGIIQLYDEFKALHPKSVLMPKVEASVQKNIRFNDAVLPDDIHILETDSVTTLKELTDRYLGKVVLIDVWATWCGPCREAFAYAKPLQQYARDNDIVLLYITIDEPDRADLWRKMVCHYDLKGEHAIINDAFKMEVYKTFGDSNAILTVPHYAIINKKGEIQFLSAASVENLDELKRQLEEASRRSI